MKSKHWKRIGGILFLFLALGTSIRMLHPTFSPPEAKSGFLGLVQELETNRLHQYSSFYNRHDTLRKTSSIEASGSVGDIFGILGTGANSKVIGNIDIVSQNDIENKLYHHMLDIDIQTDSNVNTGSQSNFDLKANIDIYTDRNVDSTYIRINKRNLAHTLEDANISILDQFIQLQKGVWIHWAHTDIVYTPGRRLELLDTNMQRARIVPDLKIQDGWYITSTGSGASLEANISPNTDQIELEDKNNVFKVWIEREDTADYDISILTAPDIKGRLDGIWEFDINKDSILESSDGSITFPTGIDISYVYKSIVSQDSFDFEAPVIYIDGKNLLDKILTP